MTLIDLGPLKYNVLVICDFFLQLWAAAYIPKVNYDEMADDRPKQPVHEIFSIERTF